MQEAKGAREPARRSPACSVPGPLGVGLQSLRHAGPRAGPCRRARCNTRRRSRLARDKTCHRLITGQARPAEACRLVGGKARRRESARAGLRPAQAPHGACARGYTSWPRTEPTSATARSNTGHTDPGDGYAESYSADMRRLAAGGFEPLPTPRRGGNHQGSISVQAARTVTVSDPQRPPRPPFGTFTFLGLRSGRAAGPGRP